MKQKVRKLIFTFDSHLKIDICFLNSCVLINCRQHRQVEMIKHLPRFVWGLIKKMQERIYVYLYYCLLLHTDLFKSQKVLLVRLF